MSLLALLAAASDTTSVPVVATGPTWTNDETNGGGSWTTPTEMGVIYSPASGTATPEQQVTVNATAQSGYHLTGDTSWSHTFPAAPDPDGVWYPMPTAFPWNAPDYLDTPTYDGSGSTVHPDVIDFAQLGAPNGKWNGYRYWMIHTPFFNSDEALENPSVLVSDKAAAGWHNPPGVRDPLWPRPGEFIWNNDVDWVYDPDADELVLVYKAYSNLVTARSADGVTWPSTPTLITTSDANPNLTGASPALVRVSATEWRIWSSRESTNTMYTATTSDPTLLTGWSTPVACTFPPMTGRFWHHDVILLDGVFHACLYNRTTTGSDQAPAGLVAATSTDGVTWSIGSPDPFLWRSSNVVNADRPEGWRDYPQWFVWDRYVIYRPTIQPHEDGTNMRLWYSARGDSSWRVGYIKVPRTLWPAPPV